MGAVGPAGAGKAARSRTKWLNAGGGAAAAAIAAVIVVVIVTVSGNDPDPTPPPPVRTVDSAAVLFPSADQARQFMSTSADTWQRCGGQTVSVATENGEERWTVAELAESDSQIAQLATQEAAGGYACQHVVRVVSNVVIEAAACHDDISDEANRIAEEMAANVPA